MKKILFLFAWLLAFPAIADTGFSDRLATLDHTDKTVITQAIELYRELFASASDEEKASGFFELTGWIRRGVSWCHGADQTWSHVQRECEGAVPFTSILSDLETQQREIAATLPIGTSGVILQNDLIQPMRDVLKRDYQGLISLFFGEGDIYFTPGFAGTSRALDDILPDDLKAYANILYQENFRPTYGIVDSPRLFLEFLREFPDSTFAFRVNGKLRGHVTQLLVGGYNDFICMYDWNILPHENWIKQIENLGQLDEMFAGIANEISTAFRAGNKCDNNRFEGVDYDGFFQKFNVM